jgi:hypothetical protein
MRPSTTHTLSSPLLLLPPKLRNMIYTLVLTTADPISCSPNHADDPSRYLNQPKSTCRQLHAENCTLLPTNPHIIIPLRTDSTEAASVACARALRNQNLTSLTRIDVHERIPFRARSFWTRLFDLRGIRDLVALYTAEPPLTINEYLSSVSEDNEYCIMRAAAAIGYLIVRKEAYMEGTGQRPVYPYSFASTVVKYMARVWDGYGQGAPVFPKNLRLKPKHSDVGPG